MIADAWGPEAQALAAVDPTQTSNIATPASALAIGAHSDDCDYFAGGVIAKWATAGARCVYLVLTDGSKGSWEDRSPADLTAARADEQRASARFAGVADVRFLGREDGFLEATLDLRAQIAGVIRDVKPEIVLGHVPWTPYRLHPDHRAAGFATVDAVAVARETLCYPGTPAHRPNALWLFETKHPNHAETIDVDAKTAALLHHKSQLRSTMAIEGLDDFAGVAAFTTRMRRWAAIAGEPYGLHAGEAFKTMNA